LLWPVFGPRAQKVGRVMNGVDLDDQIPNFILSVHYQGLNGEKHEDR
jgi:hypothetical protein